MKLVITVALGLMLAGCVSAGNEQNIQLQAAVQEAKTACDAAAKAKKITSYAALGRCLANAEAPLASTWGTNADLVSLFHAQRIAIMERIDRKQLTEAQGIAEIHQLLANINSEAQRRNNASLAVAAQQEAAMAAMNANLAASRPVTCYRFGNMTNCY